MVFDSFKNATSWFGADKGQRRAEKDSRSRQQDYETDQLRRAEAERQRKIAAVRIITGDVKYRYAIVETVRAWAAYVAEPGQAYDPTESTHKAMRSMQEQAYKLGADAVIHAQYNLLRYTVQRGKFQAVPAYETHAFGTAIKILGPPSDWPDMPMDGAETASE